MRASAPRPDALGALRPLLACPSCKREDATLAARAESFFCANCKAEFPIFKSGDSRIPWLFRDPDGARLEWRARFNAFLHANSAEHARLTHAASETRRSKSAAARLATLLEARDAQRKEVVELLGPLALGAARASPNLDHAAVLHDRLPKRAGLTSHYDNLFRDWSWENGENESLVECVRQVLHGSKTFRAGKLLTLGAGACRLSYDLHRRYAPDLSVALDLNPLPLLLAARVLHGDTVTLHEFPVAPLNKGSVAIARSCAAPEPLPPDGAPFVLVLADALHAPFKAGSFDTVLTAWLIDVVPQNLVDWVRTVNRLLAKGGTWINTGPLAFQHRNEAWCYGEEETLALVAANGFEIVAHERKPVPYLQSPASGRGRIERVLTFSATKTADADAPERAEHYPAWLLDVDRPVPDLDEFVVASSHRLLQAQILAAIDGRRSIAEIAQLVAKRYGLQKSEAEGAVRRMLLELYETTLISKLDPTAAVGC